MASARAAAGTPSQRVRTPRKTQSGGEEGEEDEGGDGEDRFAAEPGASPLGEGLEEPPGLAEVEEAREEARPREGDGEGGEEESLRRSNGFPAQAEPGHQPEAEARKGRERDDRGGGMHALEAGEGAVQPAEEAALRFGDGVEEGREDVDVAVAGRKVLVGRAGWPARA